MRRKAKTLLVNRNDSLLEFLGRKKRSGCFVGTIVMVHAFSDSKLISRLPVRDVGAS
jgi:hypothetical protein